MIRDLFATNGFAATAAATLGIAIIALVWRFRSGVRGTTLTAPWAWACLSVASVAGTEAFAALSGASAPATAALRFAAAMSTFCPPMAVLGAKRPQNRAWQFIVLSLWAILCLPAAEWLLLGTGTPDGIHAARSWFLAILIVVAGGNYLPTRFWPSSLLFSAAQLALLSAYLPLGAGRLSAYRLSGAQGPLAGLALGLAAVGLVALGVPRARPGGNPLDRVWLDFRDRFGAVWALRVAERINAAARQYAWPVQLEWNGFRTTSGEPFSSDESLQRAIGLTLRNLLRRFVSAEWLAARGFAVAADVDRGENSGGSIREGKGHN